MNLARVSRQGTFSSNLGDAPEMRTTLVSIASLSWVAREMLWN